MSTPSVLANLDPLDGQRDVEDWLRNFEKLAAFYNWQATQKVPMLALQLTGSTDLWLWQEEKKGELGSDDWDGWKEAVLREGG